MPTWATEPCWLLSTARLFRALIPLFHTTASSTPHSSPEPPAHSWPLALALPGKSQPLCSQAKLPASPTTLLYQLETWESTLVPLLHPTACLSSKQVLNRLSSLAPMIIITLIQNIITFVLGSYTSFHRHPVPSLAPSLSPPPTLNGLSVQARHPFPSMTFRTPHLSLWSLPLTLAIHQWPSMIWSLPAMLVLPLYPSDFLGLSPCSSPAWQAYLPSQTPTQLADFLPSFQTQLLYHHLPEPPATSRVKVTAPDGLSVQSG